MIKVVQLPAWVEGKLKTQDYEVSVDVQLPAPVVYRLTLEPVSNSGFAARLIEMISGEIGCVAYRKPVSLQEYRSAIYAYYQEIGRSPEECNLLTQRAVDWYFYQKKKSGGD